MTGMRILFLYLGNSTLGKIRLSPMTLLTDGIVNNGSFLGSLDSVAVHARKIFCFMQTSRPFDITPTQFCIKIKKILRNISERCFYALGKKFSVFNLMTH